MEASQALRPGDNTSGDDTTTLHGMFLWDGDGRINELDDSSEFVAEVKNSMGIKVKSRLSAWQQTVRKRPSRNESRTVCLGIQPRAASGRSHFGGAAEIAVSGSKFQCVRDV
jgi:hypothetical protein